MNFINKTLIVSLLALTSNAAFSEGTATYDTEDKLRVMDRFIRDVDEANSHVGKARPEFVKYFGQAQTALSKNNAALAAYPVEQLHKIPKLNAYEESRVVLVDYWYQGLLGHKELENEAAMNLMNIGSENFDNDILIDAGMRLLKRQIKSQNFGAAIETLARLREVPESETELDTIRPIIKKLDEITVATQDISQQINSDENGLWATKLMRSTFYLDKIVGDVNSIDFNCANKIKHVTYKPDSVLSTPAKWGSCTIKITGSPKTSYTFVQLAKKPIPQ